jgi:hypothetical protein
MIRVRPSSCVTVKVCPFVTVTEPVKSTRVPLVPLSMREASVPAVFSTILKALLLPSQVPTVALVPEKLNGEFTSNVTSGDVTGTFAGTALWEVASETCQRFPVMVLACAVPTPVPAKINTPTSAVNTLACLIECLLMMVTPV